MIMNLANLDGTSKRWISIPSWSPSGKFRITCRAVNNTEGYSVFYGNDKDHYIKVNGVQYKNFEFFPAVGVYYDYEFGGSYLPSGTLSMIGSNNQGLSNWNGSIVDVQLFDDVNPGKNRSHPLSFSSTETVSGIGRYSDGSGALYSSVEKTNLFTDYLPIDKAVDLSSEAWSWICLRYRSDPNIKRWVRINPDIGNTFEYFFDRIYNFLDPDKQSGVMLDFLGEFVGLYPRPSYLSGNDKIVVNDELYRMLIKGKIFKNSGRATIDNICDAVEYVTGAKIKELDDKQDMTYQLVFIGDISDYAKIVLDNFDIFPRPQGVKSLGYRIEVEAGFGYDGPYGSKFRQYDEGAYNS